MNKFLDDCENGFLYFGQGVAPMLSEHVLSMWDSLAPDRYLQAEHCFRNRRYSRLILNRGGDFLVMPHEPYFQSRGTNSYAGGIARDFEPISFDFLRDPSLRDVILFFANRIDELGRDYVVGLHPYRVLATSQNAGFPTPEGIHQDDVDFFAVYFAGRQNVEGGISRIYDLDRAPIWERELEHLGESILVDDTKCFHDTSPVQVRDSSTSQAHRDVLVIDYFKLASLKV